ncbi:NAD(P)H-quinone oxidoreductase [Amphibacillus sp. Q70]|uniref:NAD(P)H-quinone oxidoreductase n=1 Tax=Amphibacillus sp. Q70 TaxID=3453416 RepID=UPI003F8310D1
MKAIIAKQPGGAEQLQITERPSPIPNGKELLIKVEAVGVNRLDVIKRESNTDHLEQPILGVEVAGVVEKSNPNSNIDKGTRVMGLVSGGAYAEYALIPSDRAMVIPDNLSYEQAAAIPEVFLTAYQTLFWLGNLQEDETVLIHAGGSGVGTAAIQLAKQLKGANVIITAGTTEKLNTAKTLGASYCINYKEQAFDQEVLQATDDRGVDLILDFIGASYWEKNLASLSVDGRWVLIGTLGGSTVEQVSLTELMTKRIQLTGTLLTPRNDQYKAKLATEFIAETSKLFKNNQLKPVIDRVFNFDQMSQAHEYMEENKNIGKIIVKL